MKTKCFTRSSLSAASTYNHFTPLDTTDQRGKLAQGMNWRAVELQQLFYRPTAVKGEETEPNVVSVIDLVFEQLENNNDFLLGLPFILRSGNLQHLIVHHRQPPTVPEIHRPCRP